MYIKYLPSASAPRPPDADFSDLLPDVWVQAHAGCLPANC
jgi:hypothetical protein